MAGGEGVRSSVLRIDLSLAHTYCTLSHNPIVVGKKKERHAAFACVNLILLAGREVETVLKN